MFKPVELKPLPNYNYKLWLCYSDGVEGEVDLSDFAGKGVFDLWNNYDNFEKAYIGEYGQIAWNNEIELCPDSLYMRMTGKSPEEVFPKVREMKIDG